jgi:hypothetical protein
VESRRTFPELSRSIPTRYYVDLESIVRDGSGMLRDPLAPPQSESAVPEALELPRLPARPAARAEPDCDTLRFIVSHALLAPSAHNVQFWKLVWRSAQRRLECLNQPTHRLSALDFENVATYVAFGALVEKSRARGARRGLRRAHPRVPGVLRQVPWSPGLPRHGPLANLHPPLDAAGLDETGEPIS